MITIRCDCGASYQADDANVGRALRCKGCGKTLEIVAPAAVASKPAASPTTKAGRHNPMTTAPQRERRFNIAVGWAVAGIIAFAAWGILSDGNVVSPISPQPASELPEGSASVPVSTLPPELVCDASAPRPRSGAEIGGSSRGGLGKLTVMNGTAHDAVAVLINGATGRGARAIYIRGGENGLVTQVPVGKYRIQFRLGTTWQRSRTFCEVQSTSEFDRPLAFEEIDMEDGIRYSAVEISLHAVPGGHARTHAIPDKAFELPPPGP